MTSEADRAELLWLRHHQAALDARLARVEDSMVFRFLRAVGGFYQTSFRGDAGSSARDYRSWAARHPAGQFAANPSWAYQPTISISTSDPTAIGTQTYPHWTLDAPEADYHAVLPPGTRLFPGALAMAVAAMQSARPERVYFDHQIVDESGEAVRPVFKPDWSPVLGESCDYMGSFVLVSRQPGSGVLHIPQVAYSTRTGISIRPSKTAPTVFPRVSILICSRNAHLVSRCAATLRASTNYPDYEVVVVHHLGSPDEEAIIRWAAEQGVVRVPYAEPFNFSAMNNAGAKAASGEVLLFLNDDVEALEPEWLGRLVSWLERPEIGAVGAKLVFPNGSIQHAGIAVWVIDGAGHPGRNMTHADYWPWLNATREVTAVTGACLCMRRRDFESLGGFDVQFPVNFNDVDLCLRVRERGLSVVVDTGAVLQHDESRTRVRGVEFEERRRFFLRWWKYVENVDPFYSPWLAQNNENLSLRE